MQFCMQGFWKGVLPSIVMVSNPSVNYMLYEYLLAGMEDWLRTLSVSSGRPRPPVLLTPCIWQAVQDVSDTHIIPVLRTGAEAPSVNHGELRQTRPTGKSCCLRVTHCSTAKLLGFLLLA